MANRRDVFRACGALALFQPLSGRANTTMLKRRAAASNVVLPVVGLGTYSVFDVAGSADEIALRRDIVKRLFRAGGSVIDTSPMYNRSERIIGDVLAGMEDAERAFIATKVWADGEARGRAQMQRSAELMRTPVIDLMQVHNRRDINSQWPVVEELISTGRIRFSGITDYRDSAHEPLQTLMRKMKPDFIQINYSIGETAAEDTLLPLAESMGIGVIINRPFMTGRLFRAVGDQPLPEWAAEFAGSWGLFFLKYIIAHPAVTCVIPATSKLKHVNDNLQAGFGRLPNTKTRERMRAFIRTL